MPVRLMRVSITAKDVPQLRSPCSRLPDRLLGLVIVHDDVGVIARVDFGEVELLIPLAKSVIDLVGKWRLFGFQVALS
jgi:hypothetical protein